MTTNFDSVKKMLELYRHEASRRARCVELAQELEELLPEGELVIVGNGDAPTAENIAFVREWADYYERALEPSFDYQPGDDDDPDSYATENDDLTEKKEALFRALRNILAADFD